MVKRGVRGRAGAWSQEPTRKGLSVWPQHQHTVSGLVLVAEGMPRGNDAAEQEGRRKGGAPPPSRGGFLLQACADSLLTLRREALLHGSPFMAS